MNSKKQQKKTIESLVITILVLLMFTITMSFAYFTARSSATSNSMTFGTLEVVIEDDDPAFGMSNGVQCAHELMPGCTIYFSGVVNLGTSTIDAFVRLKPKVTITTWNGTTVTRAQATLVLQELVMKAFEKYDFANDQNGNGDWFRPIVSGVPTGNYLYYAGKFIPDDSEAQDGIELYNFATAGISMPIDATAFGNDWQGCVFNVSLVAQAIQAEHLQYVDSNEDLVDLTASDYSSLSNRSAKTAFVNKLAGVSREGENENISVWEELFAEDEEEIEGDPINDLNITTDITIDYEEPEQEPAQAQGAPVPAELLSGNSSSIKSLNGNNYISSKLLSNNQNYYVKVGLNADADVSGTLSIPQYVMYNYNNNTWNRELNPGEYALIYSTQTGNGNQVVYKVVEIGYVPETQVLVREEVPEVIVLDEDVELLIYDLVKYYVTNYPGLNNDATNDSALNFDNLFSYDNNNYVYNLRPYTFVTTSYPKTWKAIVIYLLLGEETYSYLYDSVSAIEDAYDSVILAIMDEDLPSYVDFVAGYEQEREQYRAYVMEKLENTIYTQSKGWLLDCNNWGDCWGSNTKELKYDNGYYMYYRVDVSQYTDILNIHTVDDATIFEDSKEWIAEANSWIGGSDNYSQNDDIWEYDCYNCESIDLGDDENPYLNFLTYDSENHEASYKENIVSYSDLSSSEYLEDWQEFVVKLFNFWNGTQLNSYNALKEYFMTISYEYNTLSELLEDDANHTSYNSWKTFVQELFGIYDWCGPTTFNNYEEFLTYFISMEGLDQNTDEEDIYEYFRDQIISNINNNRLYIWGQTYCDSNDGRMYYGIDVVSKYTDILVSDGYDGYVYKYTFAELTQGNLLGTWREFIQELYGAGELCGPTTFDSFNHFIEYYDCNTERYGNYLLNPDYILSSYIDNYIYDDLSFDWFDWINNNNNGDYWGITHLESDDPDYPTEYWMEYYINPSDYVGVLITSVDEMIFTNSIGWINTINSNVNSWGNIWEENLDDFDSLDLTDPSNPYLLFVDYDNENNIASYKESCNSYEDLPNAYINDWKEFVVKLYEWWDGQKGYTYQALQETYTVNPVYKYNTLSELLEADDANHTLYNRWKNLAQELFGAEYYYGTTTFLSYGDFVLYATAREQLADDENATIYNESKGWIEQLNCYNNYNKYYPWKGTYIKPDINGYNKMVYGIDVLANYIDILQRDNEGYYEYKYNTLSDLLEADDENNTLFTKWQAFVQEVYGLYLSYQDVYGPSRFESYEQFKLFIAYAEEEDYYEPSDFEKYMNLYTNDLQSALMSAVNNISGNGGGNNNDGTAFGSETITSIILPEGITYIPYGAFYGCTALESITLPSTLEGIDGEAFSGCTSLTSIRIPANVTYLGDDVFYGCTNLSSISFAQGSQIESIGNLYQGNTNITNIVLPNTITYLYNSAFEGCTALESITLPSGITTIPSSAFKDCTSLESITIPSSVNTIQYSAFEGCTALESVTFTNGITTLGDTIFKNCTSLTSITIPERQNGTTSIGTYVFQNCSALETVVLPSSITSLQGKSGLFDGCTSLASVTLPFIGMNPTYNNASADARYSLGYIFKVGSNTNIDGYTKLGNYSSNYYFIPNSLRSVTILGGPIYTSAFSGCNMLTSITIDGSATSIGASAFSNCTNLTSLTLPTTITTINGNAFNNCNLLTSVNSNSPTSVLLPNLINIESLAFSGSKFTSITLPNTVTSIGNQAFEGCSLLANINIPNSVMTIGNKAFKDCSALTNITIPNSVTSLGVDVSQYDKGGYVFQNCSALTSVTLPSSMSILRPSTFNGCSSLTSITIPNGITNLYYATFNNCTSLETVVIPSTVNQVVYGVFSGCSNIKNVYFGGTLAQWIGITYTGTSSYGTLLKATSTANTDLYINNEKLTTITASSLGNVTSIPDRCFGGCASLASVELSNDITSIGDYAFSGCSNLLTITISDSVESIGANAFASCTKITAITIPSSVSSIGVSAFNGCTTLKNVTINSGVESIGQEAFKACNSLLSITIPSTVTTIGTNVFYNCDKLVNIADYSGNFTYSSSNPSSSAYEIRSDNNFTRYLTYGDKYVTFTAYGDVYLIDVLDTSITTINDLPNTITAIYQYAFTKCKALESITIPASVSRIDKSAFYGCVSLVNVNIESGTVLQYISSSVFSACTSLVSIVIPDSVTSLGSEAFRGCSSLASVTLPNNNSFTTLNQYTFYGCSSLASITIPNTVTNIGYDVFENCISLTSITISSNVTSIGVSAFKGCTALENVIFEAGGSSLTLMSSAFKDCTSLTTITIPSRLTTIEAEVFRGCISLANVIFEDGEASLALGSSLFRECTALTSVTLSSNITSIGSNAFQGCTLLSSITLPSNITTIGGSAFTDCSSLVSIVIPNNVTSIGSYAFQYCTALTSVTFENTNNWFLAQYSSATSGTAITVTDSSANATYLKTTYYTRYWKRTVS